MIAHLLNWRYLLPRVAIAVVALLAIHLALEPVLQGFFVKFGERIIRSKIDIEQFDVGLTTADIHLGNVAVANPRSLDRNLIECESADFDIAASSILQRRLRIREATLRGVQFNTPRSKSGQVAHSSVDVDLEGEDLRKISTNALRQFGWIIGRDLQDDLLSIQLARELASRWPEELAALEAKAARLVEEIQTQQKSLELSLSKPLGGTIAFPEKVEQVERLRREYYDLKAELDGIIEQAARDQEAIAIARRHDESILRRKLTLRNLDPQELSEYLLGEDLADKSREMLSWIRLARRYWPSDVEMPQADRQSGEDIVFPGLKRMPCAVVEHMRLDGTILSGRTPVAWRGEIVNLTTDPALVSQPMVIRAETRGDQPLVLEATLDRTTSTPRDHIVLSLPKLKQAERTLGNPEQLAVTLAPGEMLLWAELHLEGEKLSGRMLIEQKSIAMRTQLPPQYGPRIVERVQAATAPCQSLQAQVRLSGTLDKPGWTLESNLGPQLAANLTAALQAELDARKIELAARLDQYLLEERGRLDAQLKSEQAKIVEKLALGSQEIEGLRRMVAGRIRLPGGRREDVSIGNPYSRR